MNRLLLFAELILDYWGGGEKKVFPASPPFPSLPPPRKKRERERKRKEIELGCARCRVGRGEGVLLGFFVVVVVV